MLAKTWCYQVHLRKKISRKSKQRVMLLVQNVDFMVM